MPFSAVLVSRTIEITGLNTHLERTGAFSTSRISLSVSETDLCDSCFRSISQILNQHRTGAHLMAYPSTSIANYFLERASQEGRALTPMQLLKLVYIAHGWYLGYTGQPLIDDEVQAWRHGPVIKQLYDRIRNFGSGAVRGLLSASVFGGIPQAVGPEVVPMLDGVWKNYSRFSGMELSDMTHRPDTPWSIAWHQQGGKGTMFAPISNELIRDHYRAKITEAQGG